MRIAMISTPFVSVPPHHYGGPELIVYELVEALLDRGHEVTLFATGDSHSRAPLRSLYDRAQWPPDWFTDLNHTAWAMSEAGQGGYDLIHTHSAAALALRRFTPDVPLVYTLHHAYQPDLAAYYAKFPEVSFVAISEDQCRRETGAPRCEVIHHGLDPSRFRWTPRPAPFVAFVGRFAREKGIHTAIDAAQSAGVPIRVAGEVHPHDREFGLAEVEPRLHRPHVTYLGCIGRDRKVPLLRDARALLAPIEWDEPFGLILIEAMLSGCPVVAFRRGSVPELIEHGVTGLIADSFDELVDFIRPGGPADQLDRQAIRAIAVARFNHRRMAAEYEQLYDRAAAKAAAVERGPGRWPVTAA
jgi:glycosyltransferase involved in cell wall biosynthesis